MRCAAAEVGIELSSTGSPKRMASKRSDSGAVLAAHAGKNGSKRNLRAEGASPESPTSASDSSPETSPAPEEAPARKKSKALKPEPEPVSVDDDNDEERPSEA